MLKNHADYKASASLRPGKRGTIQLYEKYGDDLFCVRYRYNRKLGVRIKTVEIIVDVAKIEKTPQRR